jgi:hypothetical protein
VIVATVVIGALVGTAVVVRRLWLTDTARVVDAQEAVQRYRSQQSTEAPPVATDGATTVPSSEPGTPTTESPVVFTPPVAGVYRYTTTGNEHIDVLGGTSHLYPHETTITVTAAGCGAQLRWDLLRERSEEYRVCPTATGMDLAPVGAFYHEFFQHGSHEKMVCDRNAPIVTSAADLPPATHLHCTLNDRPWLPVWEVLDRSTIEVDGTAVPVTHVRMTVQDDDAYWEHAVADWWFDDHGLPVRMTSTKESKSSSDLVGDVVYTETYTADLVTLVPLR